MQAARTLIALAAAGTLWPACASALGPGDYAVRCGPAEGARGDQSSYVIHMDHVDLLTLRNSLGAIISGRSVEDGRRVILTGDRGCALVEVQHEPRK